MNSNEKIKFIKEILSGGGVIFLITLLSYYFIAIKYEIVFNASDLPTDFIDLPFYKLAKDLGDLFFIVILFVFYFIFLQMCFTRLILTTSLIKKEKFKYLIEIHSELPLDPIKY